MKEVHLYYIDPTFHTSSSGFPSPYELPGLDLELLVTEEDEDGLQGPADQEHPHGQLRKQIFEVHKHFEYSSPSI